MDIFDVYLLTSRFRLEGRLQLRAAVGLLMLFAALPATSTKPFCLDRMNRILAAALLSPVAVLLGAWIDQYVFPLAALGHDVVRIDGVTYGTGRPAPLPAIVFFAPTKLSIPLALATYLVVLFLALPVGAFLNRKGKATLLVAVAVGALAALGAMKLFSVMLPATANVLFREQAYEYCAFIGAIAGA